MARGDYLFPLITLYTKTCVFFFCALFFFPVSRHCGVVCAARGKKHKNTKTQKHKRCKSKHKTVKVNTLLQSGTVHISTVPLFQCPAVPQLCSTPTLEYRNQKNKEQTHRLWAPKTTVEPPAMLCCAFGS